MAVYVGIGPEERRLGEVDAPWIRSQIPRRRNDGQSVCIRVRIETGDARLTLASPECGGGPSGGRPPNPRERAIIDLWQRFGLHEPDASVGDVVAFVQHLPDLL